MTVSLLSVSAFVPELTKPKSEPPFSSANTDISEAEVAVIIAAVTAAIILFVLLIKIILSFKIYSSGEISSLIVSILVLLFL